MPALNAWASRDMGAEGTHPRIHPAPTTADDIEAEVREEEQESTDRSAMNVYTFDILEYMQQAVAAGESEEMTADAIRREKFSILQGQLRAIQCKRTTAKRKFDLVEELFQKAMDRRLKAMKRIAADPPADRLIGRSMAQYIPADLIPGQARQTASYIHHDEPAPCRLPVASGGTISNSPPRDDGNALVFLTELDGPSPGAVRTRSVGAPLSGATPIHRNREGYRDSDLLPSEVVKPPRRGRPLRPLDGHARQMIERWRELGYTVTYAEEGSFNSTKVLPVAIPRDGDHASMESTALPGSSSTTKKVGTASSSSPSGHSAYDWMKLAPLHNVCLVQRRLPEEDVLREKYQADLPNVSSSFSKRWQAGPRRTHVKFGNAENVETKVGADSSDSSSEQ